MSKIVIYFCSVKHWYNYSTKPYVLQVFNQITSVACYSVKFETVQYSLAKADLLMLNNSAVQSEIEAIDVPVCHM